MIEIREAKVQAFCQWMKSLRAGEVFSARPEFRFFAGLTDDETAEAARRLSSVPNSDAAFPGLSDEGMRREIFEGAVTDRDVSPREMAAVVRLVDIAETSTAHVTDAAEFLMGAAGRLLVREFPPEIAEMILERIMDGARAAFREARA